MSARRYVETSALLRALLEGDEELRAALAGEGLFTSALTLVEAARAVRRARREGRLGAAEAREVERQLASFERACDVMGLEDEVLRLAREELPVEPVRTLDALHLASVRTLDAELGAFEVLSCDERVRENAAALGFKLFPAKSS
ncbi:MAG: PIN domain-containing protein [Anaeromyxobacteraceae bacterium]